MGIKHFFYWFKRTFAEDIYKLNKDQTLEDLKEETIFDEQEIVVDNLMIDMNGLFHSSAQKIYQYGECKPKPRLLGRRTKRENGLQKQINCFKDICHSIDDILRIVNPRRKLILCVDGPAPLSKQNQQRQRRYVSAISREEDSKSFDSNSITPGTKFMDYLTKYIDWYIRKMISENNPLWCNIDVVFSNEKCPGEGEHKIINYIRNYGSKEESYCIHGMDADLIMLALGTQYPKFYILRDEPRSPYFDYYLIDIGSVRSTLADKMVWTETTTDKKDNKSRHFDIESAINDFILICFTVGNDFLPHIPGVEIIEGGIDFMLDIYRNVCQEYGHLTKIKGSGVQFRKKSLKIFMGTLSQYEKGVLENKLKHRDQFFPDPLLENNAELKTCELDIDSYRADYYRTNLPDVDMKDLCHEYLEGMQWVLSYYTKGVPNWRWRFPHHYAPFAHTIAQHIDTFQFPVYSYTNPTVPFVQLLSVLPPKSSRLLPEKLGRLLNSTNSPISDYCPDVFDIDLSGKRREWEGTVLLPMIDYEKIESEYYKLLRDIDRNELKRNIIGKSFIYTRTKRFEEFRSYYGNIRSKVQTELIEL